jgi:hypothetical protein
LALLLTAKLALAQSTVPVTVAAFSEPVLLGMQLSVKKAARNGSASARRTQCVEEIKRTQFEPVVAQVLAEFLTPEQLHTTEAFLSTPVGRKYVKYGVLQIYQAVGEQVPEPLPEFSDAEYRQLELFAATPAGEKLIKDKVMQSPEAQRTCGAQIRRTVASCPN